MTNQKKKPASSGVFKALKPHHVDECPFVDAEPEVIPLGRRRGGRRDAGGAVGEAGAGAAGTVRRVDGGETAAACGVPRAAVRQERARGAAGSERRSLGAGSVRPDEAPTVASQVVG